jgi:hypothetical protein
MESNEKKIIKFEDYREKIIEALKKRPIKIDEPVTLLEGFVNEPFAKEISSSFVIGGPTVPMIMLLGDKSGQIYLFALKIILPDIGL